MNIRKQTSEKGQSLVLVALLFLAFAGILALVLDGGNAYAARRQAQNAADAGALAGATYMCEYNDAPGGANTAIDYAVNRNRASNAVASANLSTGTVIVTATVTQDTFLAGLIGISQLQPVAVAEAQCRPPTGMGVMPVAWSCREKAGMYESLAGIDCAQEFGPSNIYVLMDSVKVKDNKKKNKCDPAETNPSDPDYCYTQNDLICDPSLDENGDGDVTDSVDINTISPNTIDCDLDNNGIDELMAGGARSWLDLDGGGGGASELSNWLQYGFPDPIPPHTWLPEQSGVATSIFKDAADYVLGEDVILPVFNKVCPNYPNSFSDPETLAACNYGPLDDRSKAGSNMNFHVITFSKFHVTCVQTGKNRVWSEPALGLKKNDPCPGHDLAVTVGSIDENDKTIEGYFKDDQIYGYGGPGDLVDAGTFVVVLVR
jgi:hypothetical protein